MNVLHGWVMTVIADWRWLMAEMEGVGGHSQLPTPEQVLWTTFLEREPLARRGIFATGAALAWLEGGHSGQLGGAGPGGLSTSMRLFGRATHCSKA